MRRVEAGFRCVRILEEVVSSNGSRLVDASALFSSRKIVELGYVQAGSFSGLSILADKSGGDVTVYFVFYDGEMRDVKVWEAHEATIMSGFDYNARYYAVRGYEGLDRIAGSLRARGDGECRRFWEWVVESLSEVLFI